MKEIQKLWPLLLIIALSLSITMCKKKEEEVLLLGCYDGADYSKYNCPSSACEDCKTNSNCDNCTRKVGKYLCPKSGTQTLYVCNAQEDCQSCASSADCSNCKVFDKLLE